MHDSGKHSALRQTDDGTFELVVESELDDISNTDPSLTDPGVPSGQQGPVSPSRRPSKRVAILAGAVASVAVLAVIAIGVLSSSPERAAAEPDEVVGFRPYTGTPDSAEGSPSRPAPSKAVVDALSKLDDDEDEFPPDLPRAQPTPPEITESESGWDLNEEEAIAGHDVVVEVEPVAVEDTGEAEVEAEFMDEEPLEGLPEDGQPEEGQLEDNPVEEEPLEEEALEDAPGGYELPARIQSRQNLQMLRPQQLDRDAMRLDRVRPENLRGLPSRRDLTVRRLSPDREVARELE